MHVHTQTQKKEQSKFYSNLMVERMTDDQKQQARSVPALGRRLGCAAVAVCAGIEQRW